MSFENVDNGRRMPACTISSPMSLRLRWVKNTLASKILWRNNMSRFMTKPTKWHLHPASTQSDQSLRCPNEETLSPQLPTERTAKTLTRLGGCSGWFESSLGAKVILLILSWGGSIITSYLHFRSSEVSFFTVVGRLTVFDVVQEMTTPSISLVGLSVSFSVTTVPP